MMANSVNDRWLGRRLPALVSGCGFEVARFRGHGFVETSEAEYMLTIIDRGADILCSSGRIGDEAAEALKAEARRRVEAGVFFGHIAYVSLTARKPS
jgi:arsenite methyltransferase